MERPWRSVDYEAICLKGYAAMGQLTRALAECFAFCSGERRHQALGYRTPAAVYADGKGGGARIADHFGGLSKPRATLFRCD